MKVLDKMLKPILKRIIINRWNYSEKEYEKADQLGLFDVFSMETLSYWIKAEPICSNHCSGCHHEEKPFYFNALGLLIKHKCPSFICIHGLSQISPIIYIYYDYLLQGKSPENLTFKHISCTDIGLEKGGLGNNLFEISVEKMPLWEFFRFMITMSKYIFVKNRKAVGNCFKIKNPQNKPIQEPTEFMKKLPITENELKKFLSSPERLKRLKSIEKFKNFKIVVKIVSSEGCIAGYKEGDEFYINSAGMILNENSHQNLCIMAFTKLWWRVILMLERMTYAEQNEKDFESKIFDLPINCFGAGFPVGECGEILMKVELKRKN